MQSWSEPVQFLRHVAVRSVFGGKQIAIRRKRKIKRVARAFGKNVSSAAQRVHVIRQKQIGGGGGQPEDFRCQRHLARVRKNAADGLHLAVIRARTTVHVEVIAVRTDHDAVEDVIEGRPAARIRFRLGQH